MSAQDLWLVKKKKLEERDDGGQEDRRERKEKKTGPPPNLTLPILEAVRLPDLDYPPVTTPARGREPP